MKDKPLPKEIDGKAYTVNELLKDRKYKIDYYQREYKWQTKQVKELVDDLTGKFLEDYVADHPRQAVKNYSHYFLGSIIINAGDVANVIVDGQQRLTTLTLLLIYLNNLQRDRQDRVEITDLIFSDMYGERSFNIVVDDRIACMNVLFVGNENYDVDDSSESVRNIEARYQDIKDAVPETIRGPALPLFLDWLRHNVHMVCITAYSDEDGYTIFETMNDRGLPLKPADMLKGFLLSRVTDSNQQRTANDTWKQITLTLNDTGGSDDIAADCIKAWLRSQYAEKIRERKEGAKPQDWDLIGTEFHRWVGSHTGNLGLNSSNAYFSFINQEFSFYAKQYERLLEASKKRADELPEVRYIADHGFTLQYQLLLAPLQTNDSPPVILKKLRLVAIYIDIWLARRIWNWRSIDYNTLQYAAFILLKDIRRLAPDQLASRLKQELDKEQQVFSTNLVFEMNKGNGRPIHRLLARMTDWLETHAGVRGGYENYIVREGKYAYEVEHIWADKPERHTDEFDEQAEFERYRNRVGGLLLLQKSFNASYGDMTYEEKLPHYYGQNLLAKSLNAQCYSNNPGFLRMIQETGLPFQAHEHFKKADLDARQSLYVKLCETIWNPSRLDEVLST